MRTTFTLSLCLTAAALCLPAQARSEEAAPRIVTVGASVTETVHMLGATGAIVGIDSTSLWPPELQKLPRVGYLRALGTEGVLSLRPTMLIATSEAGPPTVLEQLRGAGVQVEVIETPDSVEDTEEMIERIAGLLARKKQGEALAKTMRDEVAGARARLAGKTSPGVLFLAHAASPSAPLVAGDDTPAAAMIELSGGRNVAAELDGYKPMGPEAIAAAAPEVIVLPSGGIARAGGIEAMLQGSALAGTPAGKNRRVIEVEPYVMAFGPRTGAAIDALARSIHASPTESAAR